MKKRFILLFTFLMIVLTSCNLNVKQSLNDKYVTDLNIETVDFYYHTSGNNYEVDTFDLYFKDGSMIPYINLEDAPEILIHSYAFDEPLLKNLYTHEISEGNFKIINSFGYECIFNHATQTIFFDDYDIFLSSCAGSAALFSSEYRNSSFMSSLESDTGMKDNYYNDNNYVINLEKYENDSIAILYDDGDYFLPLATFNDIFVAGKSYTFLQYNFEDLFFFSYDNMGRKSSLGKIYNDVEKKETFDLEYSRFAYHELVLLFDIQYGFQDVNKIQDFDNYFEDLGIKEAFYSGSTVDIEQALYDSLYGPLYDGHTTFFEPSPYFDTSKLDRSVLSQEGRFLNMHQIYDNYTKYKEDNGFDFFDYQVIDNTAFISFDDFSDNLVDEFVIPSSLDEISNSMQLLAYAYNDILNNKNIENVVFDISTNTGGSTDCLLYAMAMIEGVASYAIRYHNTGAVYEGFVVADINCNGVFDDKGLLELGYNVVFLTTDLSFSCGNAFPVYIQDNNPEVKFFGKRSGGGTDCVVPCVSATGTIFMLSSTITLLSNTEHGYTNNEDGCKVDVELSLEQLLDFEYIVELINKE